MCTYSLSYLHESIFSRFGITAGLNHGRCCVMQINILFSLRKIASEKWLTIYLYRCTTEYILIKVFTQIQLIEISDCISRFEEWLKSWITSILYSTLQWYKTKKYRRLSSVSRFIFVELSGPNLHLLRKTPQDPYN